LTSLSWKQPATLRLSQTLFAPHVKRVAIANPKQVRVIAHAKIKTDMIDAGVLAQLYANGFLPEVWIANEATQALRRQITRRNQIVRQRTRLKNIMQSILHANLIPACPIRTSADRRAAHGLASKSSRRMSASQCNGICASSIGSARTSR
jgi:transposase